MTNKKTEYFEIDTYMIDELGLYGSELITFALMRAFTKGEEGLCFSSKRYIAEVLGVSVSTVKRALSGLINKGYVEKCTVGKRSGYRTTAAAEPKELQAPPNDAQSYIEDSDEDPTELLYRGIGKPKYLFIDVGREGTVFMTAEQYRRLLQLISPEDVSSYVRRLELLIKEKGYRTFSPYKTIRKWIFENAEV